MRDYDHYVDDLIKTKSLEYIQSMHGKCVNIVTNLSGDKHAFKTEVVAVVKGNPASKYIEIVLWNNAIELTFDTRTRKFRSKTRCDFRGVPHDGGFFLDHDVDTVGPSMDILHDKRCDLPNCILSIIRSFIE